MAKDFVGVRSTAGRATLLCFAFFLASQLASFAQVNSFTRGYDNARTGANLNETILTPANVGSGNFGKLFTVSTDAQIYAQPLYVSNLSIAGGTHNVLYVASMRNTIYALDADNGSVLWQQNYGSPIIPQDVESDQNIVWSTRIGILSTPVIDPDSNVMYFVSAYQPSNGAQQFGYYLNAIDITDGQPVHGSPMSINATYSTPDTTAPLIFSAQIHGQRPSLALGNGNVYIAFGSHEDQNAYHGWIMAYSLSTLAQTAVYSDTTIGTEGGIWNAGQAPVIDGVGNLYYSTGNGSFGKTPNGLTQTGNSFIKLSPALELLDHFTPHNSDILNAGDMDLGSAGVMLLPGTNYLLGGGKQGVLYLVDTLGMGGYNSSTDQVRQEFQAIYGKGTSHIHGTPVYFNSDANGPSTYVWGENDVLRGFLFNGNTGFVKTGPFATSKMTAPVTNNDGAMPGGFLSVSANGGSNGIVWASTPYNGDAVHHSVQGVLYAFDANTLSLLWSDKTNDSRDEIGMFAKYVPPLVANGKMYVPSFGAVGTNDGTGLLAVYGLLKAQLTVDVANASMTAGAALPAFTGTVTGLTNGDTLGGTVIVTYSTTATSGSAPGTYPITATVTGSSAGNYTVVETDGTLTISPSSQHLTVTANNATRIYGAANPAFTGTVTGAQPGDTFTESFSTTANAASAVGNYAIVPGVSGANLANYTVTYVNGSLSVTGAATTTSLSAPANAAFGANVSLTATVASSAGTPGGSVTFYSGASNLGTAALDGGGVATLVTNALAGGSDTVTATYPATGNYSGSSSAPSTVTVSPAGQTITFAAVASRPYGSAPFAVSATSSAGSSYPVTITVQSGPAMINGGIITLKGAGSVVLLATQAGNNNYSAASATQTFQVTPAPLTASANNANRAYNVANPTFSGTITGAVGGDTFTETFATNALLNSNVGSYAIVPALSGAQLANYIVTYVNGTLGVTAAATATGLNAPASATYGASVTLTATVTSGSGTPTGTVAFQNGSTLLGTAALGGSGVASLSTAALPAGTDGVTAVYAANGNFAGSSSSADSITVTAGSQSIIWSGTGSRTYGSAPFAVSATSSLGAGYPVTVSVLSGPATISGGLVTLTGAGTVVLQATQAGNAQNAATTTTQSFQVLPAVLTITAGNNARTYGAANPVFSGSVSGGVGSDTFSESFSSTATATSNAGSYAIIPAVSGAALPNYVVNAVNGTLTVTSAASATTLTAPGSAAFGASVTLAAAVNSVAGVPTGTVTFYDGSTALGTVTLNGGAAGFTTSTLEAGRDAVTAVYAGGGNFAASTSAATTIAIGSASQTIAFSSIAPQTYGNPGFRVGASSSLGSAYPVSITVLSGPATISGGMLNLTGAGVVVLQAIQPGDTRYGGAVATQSFQVVPAALTVMALDVTRPFGAANPTLTGSVAGAVGSDTFSESFATQATNLSNAGTYPIVPSVSGPRLANYTLHAMNGALTVTAASSTVSVNAPPSSVYGAAVTLTATVASSAGTPGGTVTFSSGATVLGAATLNASGVAGLTTVALPAGNDAITATYAGTGNFAGSVSAAAILVVTPAPINTPGNYTFVASPSSLTLAGIATAKTMLTFTPAGGYSGTVTLSCGNLPANASCQFAQNQITLRGDNKPVSLGLTLSASRPQAKLEGLQTATTASLLALTFWWPGSLAGLVWFGKRKLLKERGPWQMALLLAGSLLLIGGLSGCGAHGIFTATSTTSQVTVVATATSGSVSTTQNIILTVTMTE